MAETTDIALPTRTICKLEPWPAHVAASECLAAYQGTSLSLPLVQSPHVHRAHPVLHADAQPISGPSALVSAVRDVLPPMASPDAVHTLVGRLSQRRVFRVEIEVPDYDQERERPERIVRHKVPSTALVLGLFHLMRLLVISQREAEHAFQHNLFDIIQSSWKSNQHGPYRFAVVNDRMKPWLRRHERWVRLARIQPGRLFLRSDVERLQATYVRIGEHGHHEVYTGWHWLRWCARQRKEAERRKILDKQVVE